MEIWGSRYQKIKNIEQLRTKVYGSYKYKVHVLTDTVRHTQTTHTRTIACGVARMEPWCTWNHIVYHCFVMVHVAGPTFKSRGFFFVHSVYRQCTDWYQRWECWITEDTLRHPDILWGSAGKTKKQRIWDVRYSKWTAIDKKYPLEKSIGEIQGNTTGWEISSFLNTLLWL